MRDLTIEAIPDVVAVLMVAFQAHESTLGRVLLAGAAPRDLLLGARPSTWNFYADWERYTLDAKNVLSNIMDQLKYNVDVTASHVYDPQHKLKEFSFISPTQLEAPNITIAFSRTKKEEFPISSDQISVSMDGEVETTYEFDACVRYHFHKVFMKNVVTPAECTKLFAVDVPNLISKIPWNIWLDYVGTTPVQLDGMGPGHLPF